MDCDDANMVAVVEAETVPIGGVTLGDGEKG